MCPTNLTALDDPPFFLRNSSSSESPPDGRPHSTLLGKQHKQSLPIAHDSYGQLSQQESSADDYRSVIDDLTIANKKLRKKLKRYEMLYDAHLQSEKLFEVRVHGLAPQKKKELEETLKQFAMNINTSPGTETTTHKSEAYTPQLANKKTATSSRTSRFAESGYVSMSASGQQSSTRSIHQSSSHAKSRNISAHQKRDVHSSVNDIPHGLLPASTSSMSEKAKKRMVVRRLEQIFAGKGAVGAHKQPLQQQNVAHAAAAADRLELEASGESVPMEGVREAQIFFPQDTSDVEQAPVKSVQDLKPVAPKEKVSVNTHGPDQRPTRPLDLDPHRAQIPAENLQYFKHLGFWPSNLDAEDSPEEGHGWIYLNLLANMAQLHTVNVTVEMIQSAIHEYSDKLELSHDWRKVRWRGGHDVTKLTPSDSSPDSGRTPDGHNTTPLDGSGSKSHATNEESRTKTRNGQQSRSVKHKNLAKYTPLFSQNEHSDASSSPLVSSSMLRSLPAGDSPAHQSSSMKTRSHWRETDDGPIIFYNNAPFCTDLSGDTAGGGYSNLDTSRYYRPTEQRPLGESFLSTDIDPRLESNARGSLASPLIDTSECKSPVAMSLKAQLEFPSESVPTLVSSQEENKTYDFEVTGIGGVEPRDHFAIDVVTRRKIASSGDSPQNGSHQQPRYAGTLRSVIDDVHSSELLSKSMEPSEKQPTYCEEIVSITHRHLPVSTLPPASFLPFTSSSSSDGSDDESDGASVPDPSFALQNGEITRKPWKFCCNGLSDTRSERTSSSGGIDRSNGGDEDLADDESVDLLAAVREVEPETIRKREREYDAELADRLAEEIPAGSSAATAGGGSGYASPIRHLSGSVEEIEQAEVSRRLAGGGTKDEQSRIARLKRARTSDSVLVHRKTPKLE